MSNYKDRIKEHLTQLSHDYEKDLKKQLDESRQQEYERTRFARAKAEKARKDLLHKEKLKALLADNISTVGADAVCDGDYAVLIGEAVMKRLKGDDYQPPKAQAKPPISDTSKSIKIISDKDTKKSKAYFDLEVIRSRDQDVKELESLSMDTLKGLIQTTNGKQVLDMKSTLYKQAVRASKSASE